MSAFGLMTAGQTVTLLAADCSRGVHNTGIPMGIPWEWEHRLDSWEWEREWEWWTENGTKMGIVVYAVSGKK